MARHQAARNGNSGSCGLNSGRSVPRIEVVINLSWLWQWRTNGIVGLVNGKTKPAPVELLEEVSLNVALFGFRPGMAALHKFPHTFGQWHAVS